MNEITLGHSATWKSAIICDICEGRNPQPEADRTVSHVANASGPERPATYLNFNVLLCLAHAPIKHKHLSYNKHTKK